MAVKRTSRRTLLLALALFFVPPALSAQAEGLVREGAGGVTIDFVNTDLRGAVQALARFLDRPVLFAQLPSVPVTLQTPRPVPRSDVEGILRALLETYDLEMVEAGSSYQVRSRGTARQGAEQHAAPPVRGAAPVGSGGMQLNVIRLRHARAADVAATVNALYGRGGALGEMGVQQTTLSAGLREQRIPPAGADPRQGMVAQASGGGGFAGEVALVPDARTNSLLVRASAVDFQLIQAAVEQLDVRPLQVVIEALVAEVRRDARLEWGLGGRLPPTHVRGTSNTIIEGELAPPDASELLVRAFNVTGLNIDLVLAAGEARGAVTILSRPLVAATNNEEAELLVGTQRPFIQVQRTTDGGVLDQIVQYKDVGTSLRVLPTISADGYVMLRVTQEVNSATGETGLRDAPVISTRSIQTQILVRDGQTVVLGGLADTQRDRASAGVPYLSRIPVIGALFGRRVRRSTDSELFVFLTPRVIYDDEDLEATADDVRRNSRHVRGPLERTRPFVTPAPPGEPVVDETIPLPDLPDIDDGGEP